MTVSSIVYLGGGRRFRRGQETAFLISVPHRYKLAPSVHLKPITNGLPVAVSFRSWGSYEKMGDRVNSLRDSLLRFWSGCTALCIKFWSVVFLIFLFVALADLSMGKKGALGKLFCITSRTLKFWCTFAKLLLKLTRKNIQTNETDQKQ